ncbi:MAG: efflux RND transporter periplasmic adaptor subunit [Oscillatoriaceae cyanobacterium Prado104]|nr:efflux RND transporter periplasmic adaptor subunit [Oscillatoriaceae cyanobacterium Prado104]
MTTRIEPLHSETLTHSLRKYLLSRWTIGLLLLGGMGIGGFALYRAIPARTARTQMLTAPVEQKSLPVTFSANGTVKAERSINVSPKTSGVLKELLVQEGDRVQTGQIIARMDNSNFQGQLMQSQGQLASAQANLDKLLAGNRPQEIAQSRAQLASAQANLDKLLAGNRPQEIAQVQAQLAAAQANLDKLLAGNRPQEIAQSRAELTSAQASLQQAQTNLNQNQKLYQDGAISQRDLETSRTAYATAKAQVDRVQQALNLQKSGPRTEEIAAARAQVEQQQQALKLAQSGARPQEIAAAQAQVEQQQQALELVQAGPRPEEIAGARAQVESARGALQTVQTQVNDTIIKAPFDGMVTKKYADPGSFVTPTTAGSSVEGAASNSILTLVSTNQVVSYLDEAKVSRVKVGQKVKITADAYNDRTFSGTVSQIAAQATTTQNVTSFEVKIALEEEAQKLLKAGMSVEAEIQIQQLNNAIVAPSAAIVRQQNGTAGVYVMGEDNKPAFKPIEIGMTVGDRTQVKSGLAGNEQVLISFPPGMEPKASPAPNPLGGVTSGSNRSNSQPSSRNNNNNSAPPPPPGP